MGNVSHHARRYLANLLAYLRIMVNPSTPCARSLLWGFVKITWRRRWRPGYAGDIKAGPYRVSYGSVDHFWWTYREIFVYGQYLPNLPPSATSIIDGGANIGLATLFYKLRFPAAHVDCFEPDARSAAILRRNIDQNHLTHVRIHECALADQARMLTFYSETALRGDTLYSTSRELQKSQRNDATVISEQVPAVALADYLDDGLDILKLDIEGGEGAVLRSIVHKLATVGTTQLEYHWLPDNLLSDVVGPLEEAGHRYRLVADHELRSEAGSGAMIYSSRPK